MSLGSLQRTGTEWLDLSDKNTEAANQLPVPRLESSDVGRGGDWETILEGVAETPAEQPPRQPAPVRNTQCNTKKRRVVQQTENESRRCGSVRRSLNWGFGDLCPLFKKLRYTDVGAGRWLRDESLVALRLFMLMINAVSLGLALGMRDRVPHKYLALELFTWVHIANICSLLGLLMGSLWLLRGKLERAEEPDERTSWAVVGIVAQTLYTLSQAELLRLISLLVVPSLQPASLARTAARELYSFSSPFAIQRYVVVFSGTMGLLFSRTPHRLSYVPIAVLISIVWNILLFVIRDSTANLATRLSFLIGSIFAVFKLSLFNIFLHRRLAIYSGNLNTEEGMV